MARIWYALLFVVLAVVFVPVFFDFGVAKLIAPCCLVGYKVIAALVHLHFKSVMVPVLYLLIYLGLFYVLALITYGVSMRLKTTKARVVVQVGLLALLIGCSFLPVINFHSLKYAGSGHYSFWEASGRYAKTHGKLMSEKK